VPQERGTTKKKHFGRKKGARNERMAFCVLPFIEKKISQAAREEGSHQWEKKSHGKPAGGKEIVFLTKGKKSTRPRRGLAIWCVKETAVKKVIHIGPPGWLYLMAQTITRKLVRGNDEREEDGREEALKVAKTHRPRERGEKRTGRFKATILRGE